MTQSTWLIQKQPDRLIKNYEDEIEKNNDEIDRKLNNLPTHLLAKFKFKIKHCES